MKSFFATILLIIYLAVSTGFVVSTHYCMGKVDLVQLGAVKEKTCSKCGMHTDDSGGCCRDEIKVVKLQQDLKSVALPSFEMQPMVKEPPLFAVLPFLNFNQRNVSADLHPPAPDKSHIYIIHRVFRI